jgi:tetratricopeptide (TPR) repeat protein
MLDNLIQLHRQGRLDEAESGYRRHIEARPEDHQARFLLAMLLDQRERRTEAIEQLNRAIALAPDQAGYLVALGQLQVDTGQFAAARTSLNAAVRLNPNSAAAYVLLARLARREGQREEAERQVRLALRASPDWPEAQMLAGSLAAERGDHAEATRLLAPLADRFPKDPAIQAALGQAFLAGGMLSFAEQSLRNAVALAPKAVHPRIALADLLIGSARFEEARGLLAGTLADDPGNATARVRLGDACRALGDYPAAVEAYAPAAAALADHPEFAAAHADALAHCGRFDAARQALDRVLDAGSRSPVAWQARAQIEHLAGDAAALAAVATRWREALPGDAGALETLALLADGERPAEAEALAEQALAAEPAAVGARLIKTRALVARGEIEAAAVGLETALASTAEQRAQGVLHGTLGAVMHRLGRHEAAVEHWRSVHRLSGGALPLPPLSPVGALPEAPAHQPVEDAAALRPVFLIAPPGCGGEQAAGLLLDLGLPLLSDRQFLPLGRRHGFAEWSEADWRPEPDEAQVRAFAAAYGEAMRRAGVEPGRPYVDWLPGFDGLWLATLARALPNARFVVALRDRRDAFLHWLATGSFYPTPLVDFLDPGLWMAAAMDHAEHVANAPAGIRLDIDAVASGAPLPAALLALAGREDTPDLARMCLAAPQSAGGGLPLDFEAGVWEAYVEPLDVAFQALMTPAR